MPSHYMYQYCNIVRTNFTETLIEIHAFSFKKMHLKKSSGKRRPFCLGLNALSFSSSICSLFDFYCWTFGCSDLFQDMAKPWPWSYNLIISHNWRQLEKNMQFTHWGRDEIDFILQTVFSNWLVSMKMYWLRLKFHWHVFPCAQLTLFQHLFR